MHVVQLSTFSEPCGIATYAEALVDTLNRAGVTTTVLSPRLAGAGAAEEPLRLWGRNRGTVAEAAQVLAAIVRLAPDVVHLQINAGLFSPEFVAALSTGLRRCRIPCVATLHDRRPQGWVARLRHAAMLVALGDAGLVVHNRAHAADLPGRDTTIIPHGIAAGLTASGDAERAPGDVPVIAHFGFLLPDKGVREVVAALGELRARGMHRLRYQVLGAVDDTDASRRTYRDLVRQVRRLNLGDCVHLDPTFGALDDSLRALRKADWIVLNYRTGSAQGSSGAARHALASGRPVAVSQAPIFDDLREAAHTLRGPLVDALAELATERHLAASVAARGRAYCEAHTWEKIATLHIAFYERRMALARENKPGH